MNKNGDGLIDGNRPFAGTVPHGDPGAESPLPSHPRTHKSAGTGVIDVVPAKRETSKGKERSSEDPKAGQYPGNTAIGSQDQDGGETGRAASGESYEDEADNAIGQPKRKGGVTGQLR
jgi:hypothetical protein